MLAGLAAALAPWGVGLGLPAVASGTVPDPTVQPTTEPDPFNPDVTIWPPPPPWLFPAVMVALGIVTVVVLVLVGMWIKAARVARAERAARVPKEWIDLSKLDKKGRWEDQDDNPRAGGIDR